MIPGESNPSINHFPEGLTPRPEQITALSKIDRQFELGAKIVAFDGPTGSGKSAVGQTCARQERANSGSTFLITAQVQLQQQYADQWPSPEIEPLKGRSHYTCDFDKDDIRDASKGYCRRVAKAAVIPECLRYGTMEQAQQLQLPPEAHKCAYWAQVMRAINSPITLFNFHSFLFQQRLNRFKNRNLLIVDECHNIEQVLLQFVQLVISDKILRKIGLELDLTIKNADNLVAWLDKERIIPKIMETLGENAKNEGTADGLTPQETDRLRSMLDRIEDLRKYLGLTEWVLDVTEEVDENDPTDRTRKLRARPVFVGLFAKELLFSKAQRTLAMSATILNPKIWAKNLGIARADLGYVDIPCSFPLKNRPIYCEYAGDMSWANLESTLPKLYGSIENLLLRHQNVRGIVHAHSEKLCKLILENVGSPRFLHLDMFPYRSKTELLKRHMERPDSVIVASGFHEGVDLADDRSRFQIVAKVPWPGTSDPWMQARMKVDGSYMGYSAALKLVQCLGRSVRHESDHAVSYILDSGFDKFLKRCGWLLPKWFTDAIVRA